MKPLCALVWRWQHRLTCAPSAEVINVEAEFALLTVTGIAVPVLVRACAEMAHVTA